MGDINKIYKLSLTDHKSRLKKLLRENDRCYASLTVKDSDYAIVIKALGDLHRKAYEVYNSAPESVLK